MDALAGVRDLARLVDRARADARVGVLADLALRSHLALLEPVAGARDAIHEHEVAGIRGLLRDLRPALRLRLLLGLVDRLRRGDRELDRADERPLELDALRAGRRGRRRRSVDLQAERNEVGLDRRLRLRAV